MPITSGASRGLLKHLVEVVDDHVGEFGAADIARDDCGNVVQLLRIRDGEDAPSLRASQETPADRPWHQSSR